MGKKRSLGPPISRADGDLTDQDRRQSHDSLSPQVLNAATASLGALLALLVGYFIAQLQRLDELGLEEEVFRARTVSDGDVRGVARLTLGFGKDGGARTAFDVAGHVDRNEPFVCRRCVDPSSLPWWDDDANLIEAAGQDAGLPVRVARRAVSPPSAADGDNGERPVRDEQEGVETATQFRRIATPGVGSFSSAYEERNLTVREFFASYRSSGRGTGDEDHLYAAQVDVASAIPGLMSWIERSSPPPQILDPVGSVPPPSHHPVTVYLGSGPLTTQTHYDSLENIVCVLSGGGGKVFDLYDPASSSAFLYIDRSVHGNGSPIPTSTEKKHARESQEFPLAKYAHPSQVRLFPGDCLYLPVYWYHSVTSKPGRVISANWWKMPDRNKMIVLENMFCGRQGYGANAKC